MQRPLQHAGCAEGDHRECQAADHHQYRAHCLRTTAERLRKSEFRGPQALIHVEQLALVGRDDRRVGPSTRPRGFHVVGEPLQAQDVLFRYAPETH